MHGSLSTAVPSSNLSSPQALPRCAHIIAIDLGKFNSVLCIFNPATAAHSFVTLTTDPESITRELEKVAVEDRASTLVVFETCEISE